MTAVIRYLGRRQVVGKRTIVATAVHRDGAVRRPGKGEGAMSFVERGENPLGRWVDGNRTGPGAQVMGSPQSERQASSRAVADAFRCVMVRI
jgi:hypothetical protein